MQPLPPDKWPEDLSEIRNHLGKPLNIHNMMAHHPGLMKAWSPFRNHVVGGSSLSPRQRELLILRTSCNCQADYEWEHHVIRGLQAGLAENEIERVKLGPGADGWQADEVALLSAADDCHHHYGFSAETLEKVKQHFSDQQQLDITVTVGMYMTLALIIKTWNVPME